MPADPLARRLRLAPHPEGGHYRRIYTASRQVEHAGVSRPALTAIEYLLGPGERGAWHRVDADEAWHWLDGGAIELLRADAGQRQLERIRLGPGPADRTLAVVPAGIWQCAASLGEHALLLCSVGPGFAWEGFELPDPDGPVVRRLRELEGR